MTKYFFERGIYLMPLLYESKVIKIHMACRHIFKPLQAIKPQLGADPHTFARRKSLRYRHNFIAGDETKNAQATVFYPDAQPDSIGHVFMNKFQDAVNAQDQLVAGLLPFERQSRKRFARDNQPG